MDGLNFTIKVEFRQKIRKNINLIVASFTEV